MKKRYSLPLWIAASAILGASLVSCALGSTSSDSAKENDIGTVVDEVPTDDEQFNDSDSKDVSEEEENATITVSDDSGTISDTTRGSSGSVVTITSKGTYRVTGTSKNVQILINDETKSGNVYLILDGVNMTNANSSCIYVKNADKVILQCVGENTITSTNASAVSDGDDSIDAAIFACDDLTINGEGSLTVNSKLHGIVCKDDLKITGSVLNITASKKGIDANDSVRIGGGSTTINASHDGIQVENSKLDSYFYMDGGSLDITAGYDGIDVGTSATSGTFAGSLTVAGGEIEITAGGGSSKSQSSTSQKGLKCEGDIYVGEATITVSSADDAIHSNASISVTDGTLTLSSSDDGIHADSKLKISGGTVKINKSYEGLEAYYVELSGGKTSVYASDDGINAAGGSDTSSSENPWSRGTSSSTGTLTISGGEHYINASGDGLDSNGNMFVTGGTTIVEGPTDNGNGPLDVGDNGNYASVTGGTLLAIGSSGMAVNFSQGSQCAGLVSLSGSKGTTISVNDGSGFSFTASKSFSCAVYTSPKMSKGSSYTITAGSSSATMSFTSSYFYSNVGGGGGGGSQPGGPGRH